MPFARYRIEYFWIPLHGLQIQWTIFQSRLKITFHCTLSDFRSKFSSAIDHVVSAVASLQENYGLQIPNYPAVSHAKRNPRFFKVLQFMRITDSPAFWRRGNATLTIALWWWPSPCKVITFAMYVKGNARVLLTILGPPYTGTVSTQYKTRSLSLPIWKIHEILWRLSSLANCVVICRVQSLLTLYSVENANLLFPQSIYSLVFCKKYKFPVLFANGYP